LAAFFWKRVTTAGGVASIIGGIIATVVTKILVDVAAVQQFFSTQFGVPGAELGEYIIIPSFFVAVILLVFVSLATPRQSDERLKAFFPSFVRRG